MVTLEDFKKLDIRTAKVTDVRDHPDADRLLIVEVDTGDEKKEIVAGIKKFYSKDDLMGKDIVMINNLEPATIRGVRSNGMLLVAQDGNGIVILKPEKPTNPGCTIR
ncbi:MAG: hypothetical protein ISS26_06440 [Candidatus Omnitrophica bacterium]|nr:hypothetical protein [Candidatus Omnitrophota bacterium]